MAQKVFYRYNPASEQYERVYPDRRQRWGAFMRNFLSALMFVAVLAVVIYYFVDTPRERELRQQNRILEQKLERLNTQAERALAVMDNLAERDNNFYRVMMHAEPLTPAQRYAGLERERNLDHLDSLADNALVRSVGTKLDALDRMVASQIKSFDALAALTAEQKDRTAHIPAIQPVPQKYMRSMASGYGQRIDPIYGTVKFHKGMDFASPVGTPVYATADGTVTHAAWQGTYGNLVEIDHGYNYTTRYAHMSQIIAKPGQQVHRGDLIGLVGNTGKSTGPHLHYEVRIRGEAVNPVNYYFYDITPEQYDEIITMAENAGHVMD